MSLGSSSAPDSSITRDSGQADRSPFEIGDWLVEPDRLRVVQEDDARQLEPMAMRLLVFLAERPDRVISRAEILKEVWEGRAVVDETLSRGISLVRQALGDDAQNPRFIETVPKQGYRVIAPVRRPTTKPDAPLPIEPAGPISPSHWRIPALLTILLALVVLWSFGGNRECLSRRRAHRRADPSAGRCGRVARSFTNLLGDLRQLRHHCTGDRQDSQCRLPAGGHRVSGRSTLADYRSAHSARRRRAPPEPKLRSCLL